MTDEELIARLRDACRGGETCKCSLNEAANRIEALRADLKSTRIRIEIVQAVCLGLSEQLMKAHTEIAQALGDTGGEG